MRCFSWVISAVLVHSSLNRHVDHETHAVRSLRSSNSPVLRLRQLPGTIQTVTATVTVTVTQAVLPTPSVATSPPTSTIGSPPATAPVSQTASPPEFVTATDQQGIAPSSTAPPTSLTTSSILALPTGSNPSFSALSTLALAPTSTLLPTDTPISVLSVQGTSLASTDPSPTPNSSSGGGNGGPRRERTDAPRGLKRLLILCIVILVICSLGLAAGLLCYLSPHLRNARRRKEPACGPIVEDYAAVARTFEPNPTGTLNYQRSLSRKRKLRPHLLRAAGLPTSIPRPQPSSFDAGLWLPQNPAGPGLSRPAI